MNTAEPITFEQVATYARRYDLLIKRSEDYRRWLVYRILPHRVVYVGYRLWGTEHRYLRALHSFIKRLSSTADYEQSKCA